MDKRAASFNPSGQVPLKRTGEAESEEGALSASPSGREMSAASSVFPGWECDFPTVVAAALSTLILLPRVLFILLAPLLPLGLDYCAPSLGGGFLGGLARFGPFQSQVGGAAGLVGT